MKPLPDDFFSADKARTELQIMRENEVQEFIDSGVKVAELEMFGNASITSHLEGYKKAVRKLVFRNKLNFRIRIRQKEGKVIAERKDEEW